MKRLLIPLLCFAALSTCTTARAQTAVSRAALNTQIDTLFADDPTAPDITPADFRTALKAMTASMTVPVTDGTPVVTSGTYANPSWITSLAPAKLTQSGATSGQVLKWNGSAWAPAADVTGGGGGSSSWADITGTPTTLAGYGITDADSAGSATAAQAYAVQRGNHSGTQTAATISDFASAARAQVEAALVAGANVTITASGSGATRSLTVAASGSGGSGGGYSWSTLSGTTPALVFSGNKASTITLAGSTTFSASGYVQDARYEIYVTGGSADYPVAFPSWTWVGSAPLAVPAGKKVLITAVSTGTTASSVYAAWAIEGANSSTAARDIVTLTTDTTLDSSHLGKTVVIVATAADTTITLPASASFGNQSLFLEIDPASTKWVTIDANGTENIGPGTALTRRMRAGETAELRAVSGGLKKVTGITIPLVAKLALSSNQTGAAANTATKVAIDTSLIDSMSMNDTTNRRIYIRRPGRYEVHPCATGFSFTAVANRVITCVFVNGNTGSYLVQGESMTAIGGYPKPYRPETLNFALNDFVELQFYHEAASSQTIQGGSPEYPTFLELIERADW